MGPNLRDSVVIDGFKSRLDGKLKDAFDQQCEIGDDKVACRITAVGRWVEAEILRSNDDRMKVGEKVELQFWDGKSANAAWEPMYVDKRRLNLLTNLPHGAIVSGFLLLNIGSDGALRRVGSLMNV